MYYCVLKQLCTMPTRDWLAVSTKQGTKRIHMVNELYSIYSLAHHKCGIDPLPLSILSTPSSHSQNQCPKKDIKWHIYR
jgi:hypothetical protein